MRKWEGERECYVREKKGMQRKKRKILRRSVTKIEKSRYRDEFLIRCSKKLYLLNRLLLPKNSSKLSRFFIRCDLLSYFLNNSLIFLNKWNWKFYDTFNFSVSTFLFYHEECWKMLEDYLPKLVKSLLKWFRSAYIHLQCRLSIRELSRAQMS